MPSDGRKSIAVSIELHSELDSSRRVWKKPKARVETWEELLWRLLKEAKSK